MQLLLSLTSPFARKVRVALIEKGIQAQVDERVVDPWADDAVLLAANPLLQVPALVLDDGQALTNSDSILNWLERQYPQSTLWPSESRQRTQAEAMAALAQGMIEYSVFLVLEHRKPESLQSQIFIQRRLAGIERVLHALAARFDRRTEVMHMDGIGVACALAYLDFRHPQLDWRQRHPELAQWLDIVGTRQSMQRTAPPA